MFVLRQQAPRSTMCQVPLCGTGRYKTILVADAFARRYRRTRQSSVAAGVSDPALGRSFH